MNQVHITNLQVNNCLFVFRDQLEVKTRLQLINRFAGNPSLTIEVSKQGLGGKQGWLSQARLVHETWPNSEVTESVLIDRGLFVQFSRLISFG